MIDQAYLRGWSLHHNMIRSQDCLIDCVILCQISVGIHDQRKLFALQLFCLNTHYARTALCVRYQFLVIQYFDFDLYRSGHIVKLSQIYIGTEIGGTDLICIFDAHIKIYGHRVFSAQFIGSSCFGQHLLVHNLQRDLLASGHLRV